MSITLYRPSVGPGSMAGILKIRSMIFVVDIFKIQSFLCSVWDDSKLSFGVYATERSPIRIPKHA